MRGTCVRAIPVVALLAVLTATPQLCQPAELKAETVKAFNDYVSAREIETGRAEQRKDGLLWIDGLPAEQRVREYAALQRGEIAVRDIRPPETANNGSIPGGLIHDWVGIVFVPGTSVAQTLAVLQNYDQDQKYYQPDVLESKTLAHKDNEFEVFLRIKRTRIATVVFNTKYDVRYTVVNSELAYSRSYSTRIAEVENPDSPQEREMPPGYDHGFLWRLYSYWTFYQVDGGTYIQCEAISLTRGIPAGLGWVVRPFLQSIPEESLRFTLGASRDAVLKQASEGKSGRAVSENTNY